MTTALPGAELSEADREYLASVASGLPLDARDAAIRYGERLLARGLPVLFDRGHLAYVCGISLSELERLRRETYAHYRVFSVKKRSGGSRIIAAPYPQLRHVQRWVHKGMLSGLRVGPSCHGFVSGRSLKTHTLPHRHKDAILCLDIEDFFGSVSAERVFGIFRSLGYSIAVSDALKDLCTLNGALPQGAPTSPMLANLSAARMDRRLMGLAAVRGWAYTRYADDLTLSGPGVGGRRAVGAIEAIVRDSGFKLNPRKRRVMRQAQRQLVTGVVVNDGAGWPRARRRWLRSQVLLIARFGWEAAYRIPAPATPVARQPEVWRQRQPDHWHFREFILGHVYSLALFHPEEARALLASLATAGRVGLPGDAGPSRDH